MLTSSFSFASSDRPKNGKESCWRECCCLCAFLPLPPLFSQTSRDDDSHPRLLPHPSPTKSRSSSLPLSAEVREKGRGEKGPTRNAHLSRRPILRKLGPDIKGEKIEGPKWVSLPPPFRAPLLRDLAFFSGPEKWVTRRVSSEFFGNFL